MRYIRQTLSSESRNRSKKVTATMRIAAGRPTGSWTSAVPRRATGEGSSKTARKRRGLRRRPQCLPCPPCQGSRRDLSSTSWTSYRAEVRVAACNFKWMFLLINRFYSAIFRTKMEKHFNKTRCRVIVFGCSYVQGKFVSFSTL